jgi:hypothetical protein
MDRCVSPRGTSWEQVSLSRTFASGPARHRVCAESAHARRSADACSLPRARLASRSWRRRRVSVHWRGRCDAGLPSVEQWKLGIGDPRSGYHAISLPDQPERLGIIAHGKTSRRLRNNSDTRTKLGIMLGMCVEVGREIVPLLQRIQAQISVLPLMPPDQFLLGQGKPVGVAPNPAVDDRAAVSFVEDITADSPGEVEFGLGMTFLLY